MASEHTSHNPFLANCEPPVEFQRQKTSVLDDLAGLDLSSPSSKPPTQTAGVPSGVSLFAEEVTEEPMQTSSAGQAAQGQNNFFASPVESKAPGTASTNNKNPFLSSSSLQPSTRASSEFMLPSHVSKDPTNSTDIAPASNASFGEVRGINESEQVGTAATSSTTLPSLNPYISRTAATYTEAVPESTATPARSGVPALGEPVTSTNTGTARPLNYLDTTTASVPPFDSSISPRTYTVAAGSAGPSSTMPLAAGAGAGAGTGAGLGLEAAAAAPAMSTATPADASAQQQIDTDAQLAQSLAAADIADDTQWSLKDILWRGRETKIIMQNENGPCSLIALTNLLLLQNKIRITPADRPAVSYAYVSDMLADYLLEQNASPTELSRALSTLPKMLHGFQVDVFFDQPTHFGSDTDASSDSSGVSLFRMAHIPLLHGWLPDPSDGLLWQAMQHVRSYNGATTLLASEDARVQKNSSAEPVREFLQAYPTQLTPYGLHAVKEAVRPGELAVLFRNSHLSVIYRRREDEGVSSLPQLYMLVTDAAFQMDDRTVWERLEDTNGHHTRYYDADFEQVSRSERAWGMTTNGVGSGTTDDYALAVRLQREERERARAVQRARRLRREVHQDDRYSSGAAPAAGPAAQDPSGGKGLSKIIPKMLRKGFKK